MSRIIPCTSEPAPPAGAAAWGLRPRRRSMSLAASLAGGVAGAPAAGGAPAGLAPRAAAARSKRDGSASSARRLRRAPNRGTRRTRESGWKSSSVGMSSGFSAPEIDSVTRGARRANTRSNESTSTRWVLRWASSDGRSADVPLKSPQISIRNGASGSRRRPAGERENPISKGRGLSGVMGDPSSARGESCRQMDWQPGSGAAGRGQRQYDPGRMFRPPLLRCAACGRFRALGVRSPCG